MKTPPTKLLWLQGSACNGNAHSFLNAPDLAGLMRSFEFLYHPVLPTALTLEQVAEGAAEPEILIVEGALGPEGVPRGDVEAYELVRRYAERAHHILCVGNCAAFGGVMAAARPGVGFGGGVFCDEVEAGPLLPWRDKVINLPGCPIHPQWLTLTLRALREGRKPRLDRWLRPVELYGYTVHEGCLRNDYFEWKVDAESFGRKEGCLFYEQGCRGPYTHGSCNKILWNETSSKTRIGMPCIGCTEPGFPEQSLFRTVTRMSIPVRLPLGVPRRAYLTLTGVAKAFTIPRLHGERFGEES